MNVGCTNYVADDTFLNLVQFPKWIKQPSHAVDATSGAQQTARVEEIRQENTTRRNVHCLYMYNYVVLSYLGAFKKLCFKIKREIVPKKVYSYFKTKL